MYLFVVKKKATYSYIRRAQQVTTIVLAAVCVCFELYEHAFGFVSNTHVLVINIVHSPHLQ